MNAIGNRARGAIVGVLAVTVMLAGSGYVASAAPATESNETQCTDGDRDVASSIAASGSFEEIGIAHSDGTLSTAEITLRFSKQYNCAWGLVEASRAPADIWIERRSAAGQIERMGREVITSNDEATTHTGAYDVTSGDVRACGNAYNGKDEVGIGIEGKSPHAGVNEEMSRADTACTDWATAAGYVPEF